MMVVVGYGMLGTLNVVHTFMSLCRHMMLLGVTMVLPQVLHLHQVLFHKTIKYSVVHYNANGNAFFTGSSDTFARVWSECKPNTDDSQQPTHVIDVLEGHENDVNYVKFSGCVVASRSDTLTTKFKTSWYSHDNIVTCSCDGTTIIWIPRSHCSHGKGARWTRAYHLNP